MSLRIGRIWLLLMIPAALCGGRSRPVAAANEPSAQTTFRDAPNTSNTTDLIQAGLPEASRENGFAALSGALQNARPWPGHSSGVNDAVIAEYSEIELNDAAPLLLAALAAMVILLTIRQRRLRRELASIRAVLNSTADGLLVVDLVGAVVLYNGKFAAMWKLPNVMLESQRDDILMEYVLPQLKDPEEFGATIQRLYADPEAVSDDTIEFRDGRVFARRSEPHRIGDRIVGRVWGFRDVTSERMKEIELEEKGYAFRTFIDSLPDNIYFKDRESRFKRVNQAGARAHGYSDCRAMVGKTDFDSCTDEHAREAFADEQDLVNEIVNVVSKEEKETWPDGRETWVLTTKMPLRNPSGQIIGTFGISRDITVAKRMEQELSERERWLSAVLTCIRDSVVALDSLGAIQWMNPSASALTGYDGEGCRGKLFEEVVRLAASEDAPDEDECFRMNSLLAGRITSLERMKATVMRGGLIPVQVELTGSTIEVDGNLIAGVVLVLREAAPIEAEAGVTP